MELNQAFHNRIAKLCLEHFKALPRRGKPKPSEWTILSCIVMESGGDLSVVALGTGSKCIGKNKLSPKGDILNDSHAEIVCRRSFLRFLYDRLQNADTGCFLKFNALHKKYSIREGTRFHFFTTHMPCGDATIFPKDNVEDVGQIVEREEDYEVPKKLTRTGDVFRTGAKCLLEGDEQDSKAAGSEYHTVGATRTKPGRGDPTLSVSCSDKLSKWCHLGVQGTLLSLLFDKPLYFSTFTIVSKTPFSLEALERALYNRLGMVELEYPYKQHKLIVAQAKYEFEWAKRSDRQPSDCSISWCNVKDKSLEVAVEGKRQGVTKKRLNSVTARLKICKLELFKRFVEVCEQCDVELDKNRDLKTFNYKQVKVLAVHYNHCWDTLRKSFKVWTTKDEKLLHFFLDNKLVL
ncbi:hypothetical protein NQ315_006155 [Exocentrus adspersus]|uniref:tRNA-specific adenosine deaminase 1 n=1 Tax=Exocentrus adspersus TaxID=1586481 RepID=A0AAV8VZ78_9CUCU|nr:hypothetical protein NQ315_006155 [Exocentrus adspersus]